MLEYDFTAKFIDEVVHRFLIGEQISEIADDTYNPVEDIEELLRQRMSETAREIDALKKAQNNNAAPAADVVEVVHCKGCDAWKRNVGIADSPNGHCFEHDIDTNGRDFCSYGERKDNDEH